VNAEFFWSEAFHSGNNNPTTAPEKPLSKAVSKKAIPHNNRPRHRETGVDGTAKFCVLRSTCIKIRAIGMWLVYQKIQKSSYFGVEVSKK
jgi:hypothetical protein